MKHKRMAVLLFTVMFVCSLLTTTVAEIMTPQQIRQKYPGYMIEDDVLQPIDMNKSSVGELFVDKYAIAPALALSKGSPFLMLLINAGSSNVANYVTVTTEYAIYEFQANEMKDKGDIQVFCFYNMSLAEMLKHISMSEVVEINIRSGRSTQGKTFELSENQKVICGEFFYMFEEMLRSENLVNLALVYMIAEGTINHHPVVTKLKDEPEDTEVVEPETVSVDYVAHGNDASGEVVYSTANGTLDFSLHSGVKLGSGIGEVVQKETDAGCTLMTTLTKEAKKATPQNAETLELPYDKLYFTGPVAGSDSDSHINYSFTTNTKSLYRAQYFLRSSSNTKEESYNAFHEKLVKIYGDPVGTAKDGTLWEYTYNDVSYNEFKPLSNIASYVKLSSLEDYSQWVLTGSDGSVILIEHLFQSSSTNREFNLINYAYYDAQTMEDFINNTDRTLDDL